MYLRSCQQHIRGADDNDICKLEISLCAIATLAYCASAYKLNNVSKYQLPLKICFLASPDSVSNSSFSFFRRFRLRVDKSSYFLVIVAATASPPCFKLALYFFDWNANMHTPL